MPSCTKYFWLCSFQLILISPPPLTHLQHSNILLYPVKVNRHLHSQLLYSVYFIWWICCLCKHVQLTHIPFLPLDIYVLYSLLCLIMFARDLGHIIFHFLLFPCPRFQHIHYQNTAALPWLLRLLCSMWYSILTLLFFTLSKQKWER